MTGIIAKRYSVSGPKTAVSCGLTHSAAIRRVSSAAGGPSAAIPETVIIGDRGLSLQAAFHAPTQASLAITLFNNNPQNLRKNVQRPPISKPRRNKLKITHEKVVEIIRQTTRQHRVL